MDEGELRCSLIIGDGENEAGELETDRETFLSVIERMLYVEGAQIIPEGSEARFAPEGATGKKLAPLLASGKVGPLANLKDEESDEGYVSGYANPPVGVASSPPQEAIKNEEFPISLDYETPPNSGTEDEFLIVPIMTPPRQL